MLHTPMFVTDLTTGQQYSLDDAEAKYEYNTFVQPSSSTDNRQPASTFDDLEGMHIGVSGSSMEWIRQDPDVDIPAYQHFPSEDILDSLMGTPLCSDREPTTSGSISPCNSTTTADSSVKMMGHQTYKHVARRPCKDDYTLLKVLGKGSFGKVLLVRKKSNNKLYAMKVLRKELVIMRRQVAHTKTERLILSEIDSPFVIKLHAAFQCDDMLYLVLDYCSGGELFFHLNRAGVFPENVARFYAAELVMAIADLHQNDVVYRDLKPENVLLDHFGHIKLADFGLCKRQVSSATTGCFSLCGTPEYLAPEILSRTGHGKSVDWWALGMLVYEMVTGLPPWYTKDKRQLLLNLRAAPYSQLAFPPNVSDAGKSFVLSLLNRDPVRRLGSTAGALEVQQHPFFCGVDWDELREKKTPVPIKPCKNIGEDSTSTHNFAQQFTQLPIMSPKYADIGGISGVRKGVDVDRLDSDQSTFCAQFDGFTCGSVGSVFLQASIERNMSAMII